MTRQPIDGGHWFDKDSAELFEEGSDWNGSNHISMATGSQWAHERLYRTKSKRWVLNCWSDYQGSTETWEEIDTERAAIWLVQNGREHDDAAKEIAALEI